MFSYKYCVQILLIFDKKEGYTVWGFQLLLGDTITSLGMG